MDSFTTPVRTSDFVFAPRAFDHPWRKRYISNSSEEEEGATEGSRLAQPLMDTPEPETQLLVRHPDERGGLLSSTPTEEEGEHSSGESPEDKVNGKDVAQLDDAFLEAFENLHIGSPVGVNRHKQKQLMHDMRHRYQDENLEKDKMEE